MKRGASLLSILAVFVGCTSSSETASRDPLTTHVAVYDPPPAGLKRVRVGVPQFKVDPGKTLTAHKEKVGEEAADILTTLADNTERFEVIERAQLDQLLKEQGLEGVVDPEELAQPGRVRGVEYLLIGKVTNMRVKGERAGKHVGLLIVGWQTSDAKVKVECGVDIRLVDPTTGALLASGFGEYNRTDEVGALGFTVLGFFGGEAQANLEIHEDNRGKILRLACDDAMRKMLPKVDRRLKEKQNQ